MLRSGFGGAGVRQIDAKCLSAYFGLIIKKIRQFVPVVLTDFRFLFSKNTEIRQLLFQKNSENILKYI